MSFRNINSVTQKEKDRGTYLNALNFEQDLEEVFLEIMS